MRLPSARTAARLTAPVSTACASAFQDSRTMPAPCASDCSGNDFCYDASCHCHPGRRLLPPLVPSGVQGMWKAGKCACAATDLRATTARATARASPSSATAPRASPTSSARRLACPHDCTNHGICYNNGTLRVLLRGRLGRAWLRNAQLPERWGSGLGEGGSYQAAAGDLGVGADCSERGAAATGAPREATVAVGPERLGQQ